MHSVKAFILSTACAVLLTGCLQDTREVFGVPGDIWANLTNDQKLEVIRGYNQRSAAEARAKEHRLAREED